MQANLNPNTRCAFEQKWHPLISLKAAVCHKRKKWFSGKRNEPKHRDGLKTRTPLPALGCFLSAPREPSSPISGETSHRRIARDSANFNAFWRRALACVNTWWWRRVKSPKIQCLWLGLQRKTAILINAHVQVAHITKTSIFPAPAASSPRA